MKFSKLLTVFTMILIIICGLIPGSFCFKGGSHITRSFHTSHHTTSHVTHVPVHHTTITKHGNTHAASVITHHSPTNSNPSGHVVDVKHLTKGGSVLTNQQQHHSSMTAHATKGGSTLINNNTHNQSLVVHSNNQITKGGSLITTPLSKVTNIADHNSLSQHHNNSVPQTGHYEKVTKKTTTLYTNESNQNHNIIISPVVNVSQQNPVIESYNLRGNENSVSVTQYQMNKKIYPTHRRYYASKLYSHYILIGFIVVMIILAILLTAKQSGWIF